MPVGVTRTPTRAAAACQPAHPHHEPLLSFSAATIGSQPPPTSCNRVVARPRTAASRSASEVSQTDYGLGSASEQNSQGEQSSLLLLASLVLVGGGVAVVVGLLSYRRGGGGSCQSQQTSQSPVVNVRGVSLFWPRISSLFAGNCVQTLPAVPLLRYVSCAVEKRVSSGSRPVE